MPTYEYECSACGFEFEKLQSMTEPKLRKCPDCGRLKLNRLIGTGGGIIFKGTGFYETDFKTKKEPKKAQKSQKNPEKTTNQAKSEANTVSVK